jgi:D-galactose 1-dehydrogenase
MYAAMPDIDAVAVCTPPQMRHAHARAALAAGKHVLLEKPSTATLTELADLEAFAAAEKRVLFTTWHSQYNAAVDRAKTALAGRVVRRLAVNWKEDVRRWHPGQKWIWTAGGFGVFDPGINAISILTKILPDPLIVTQATLTFPSNCDAPIAAQLAFATTRPFDSLGAEFDWRQTGEQTWEIEADTDDTRLKLSRGGSRLEIGGRVVTDEKMAEYEGIYAEFHELLSSGRSHVDPAPLRLVADAFLIGRRVVTDAFHD